MKWYLRQQKLIERRGKPPVIKNLTLGVAEEVFLPEIKREKYIQEEIDRAEETKVVGLHWKGLVKLLMLMKNQNHLQ